MQTLLMKQGDREAMEIIWLIDPLSAVSKLDERAPKIIYRASILWKEHLIYSCAGLQHVQLPLYEEICSESFALVVS